MEAPANIKWWAVLTGPILFALFFILSLNFPDAGNQWKAGGIILWMVFWWITEPVPIPVTSLLPLLFFPFLKLGALESTSSNYGHPIIFLFMGGFFISIALEKWNLHERLALAILKKTGSSERGVLKGFIISTAFLSMWISNTACTLMMLPIALSMLHYFQAFDSRRDFPAALLLGLAISASIGGFMTLIGTPPNIVMTGLMKEMGYPMPDFAHWLLLGIPVGFVILVLVFLLLSRIFFKLNGTENPSINESVHLRYSSMGKLKTAERNVIFVFMATALAWIFKDLLNLGLGLELLNDTNIAMAGGLSLFLITSGSPGQRLLHWEDVQKLPWGILLLFGGGMNIADAMESVGFIDQFSVILSHLPVKQPIWQVLFATLLAIFASELMSNVALATILIPVVATLARGLGMEPALLVIPVTLACSCGFMMPVATPPNTIVYSSGYIKVSEMMRTGLWFNLISAIIITLGSLVILPYIL